MKVSIKPPARKELVALPDEVMLKAFRAILLLHEDPRPREYDRVEGRTDTNRTWIDDHYRILYEIDTPQDRLRVISIGLKGKSTYR